MTDRSAPPDDGKRELEEYLSNEGNYDPAPRKPEAQTEIVLDVEAWSYGRMEEFARDAASVNQLSKNAYRKGLIEGYEYARRRQ